MSYHRIPEILKNLRKPFEMNLRKDDKVLIIADTQTDPVIREATMAVVREFGLRPVMITELPSSIHVHEPTEMTARAMERADLIVSIVTGALHYSQAMQRIWKSTSGECRLIMMDQGLTVDMLATGGGDADYDEIQKTGARVHDIWQHGKFVQITSELGTNLKGSVLRSETWLTAGRCVRMGSWNFCSFPDGESGAYLKKGTANGSVVYDTSMQQPIGLLNEVIRATITDGILKQLEGGRQSDQLRNYFAANSIDGVILREISIGLNDKAMITGKMRSDKKIRGASHVSLEGKTRSGGRLRMDGVILRPTIQIDGKKIVADGQILI